MSNSGWIKLHRVLIDWEWYKTPHMVQFFIHCLLRANHEEKKWQGHLVSEGQFISGRKQLSLETGLSEQTIRTCIERLKSTSELTSKTTNKNTLFTINSWKKYQFKEEANQQPNQQVTNNQPTSNHKQEVKNIKNIENKENTICQKFEDFRKAYPGTKRGYPEEYGNFCRKNGEDVLNYLMPALKKEVEYKESLKKQGKFCPVWKNLSTWINNSCWTQEFESQEIKSHSPISLEDYGYKRF